MNVVSGVLPVNNVWCLIKPIAGHIGVDYGMQSRQMAESKGGCISWLMAHVAVVAAGHAAVALTSDASAKDRALYVAFNSLTHLAADSLPLPKWADQIVHVGCAVFSGTRWLCGEGVQHDG